MVNINDFMSKISPRMITDNYFSPDFFNSKFFLGPWREVYDPLFDRNFLNRLNQYKKELSLKIFEIPNNEIVAAENSIIDVGVPDIGCGRYITIIDDKFAMYNAFSDFAVLNKAGDIAENLFRSNWDQI